MKEIVIRKYIDGDTAISYDDGKKCYEEMKDSLDEGVILNFEGVNYVITAFLNPIIGDLILEHGDDVMKAVNISNANSSILDKIKLVKEGALVKREDMDE